jgi:hypothetical protein
MAWKPKEKQLTPEEAVALARSELAPYWLGAEPMLAGMRMADGRATAHPLDKSFDQRAWLILFVDLTEFAGEAVLLHAREWMRRYSAHDLGLLFIVRPRYSFLSSSKALPAFLRKAFEPFPVVLDHGGLIAEAFGASPEAMPVLNLFHQRKTRFARSGPAWSEGAEKEIQLFLRVKDPGLPLSPPFALPGAQLSGASSAELGTKGRSPIFRMAGKIAQEADRVIVQGSDATIQFRSPSSRVSLVGMSVLLAAGEPARVRVQLDGGPVFDTAAGSDLVFGDDGGSEMRLTEGRLYHALQSLPAKNREVTLRFPDADRLPVALYGVRFAD